VCFKIYLLFWIVNLTIDVLKFFKIGLNLVIIKKFLFGKLGDWLKEETSFISNSFLAYLGLRRNYSGFQKVVGTLLEFSLRFQFLIFSIGELRF